jgi:hypothetical protein
MRLSIKLLFCGMMFALAPAAFAQESSVPCTKRHCLKCVQVPGGSSWCPQLAPQPQMSAAPNSAASAATSKRQLHLYNVSPELEGKIKELIQQGL